MKANVELEQIDTEINELHAKLDVIRPAHNKITIKSARKKFIHRGAEFNLFTGQVRVDRLIKNRGNIVNKLNKLNNNKVILLSI